MKDIKNIDSIPDPRKKTGDKNSVNPEKFQKALKVEKSDETDKREKRNRPRKQEELEDEQDDASVSIPVPSGLFKEYMSEEEKKASALEVGEGKAATLSSTTSGDSPSQGINFIPDNDPNAPAAKLSVGVSENTSDEENPVEDTPPPQEQVEDNTPSPQGGYTENIETPQPSENNQDSQNTQQETSTKKTSSKRKEKKKTTTNKKLEKKAPFSKQATSSKEKKQVASPSKEISPDQKEVDTKTMPLAGHKNKQKEISRQNEPATSSITPTSEVSKEKSSSKDHHQEENREDIAPIALTSTTTGANIEALHMSPFANIPKDVFELFEKMVGMMQVSKNNGKSITTVKLNMPNSIFDKCELVLEHYDTAPNNYTVQFLGNPAAIQRFSDNLPSLNTAIAESKLSFSIHLPPPKLLKNYASSVSSLEKEKGDKEEENDREEKKK